jgi:hypothetical protein
MNLCVLGLLIDTLYPLFRFGKRKSKSRNEVPQVMNRLFRLILLLLIVNVFFIRFVSATTYYIASSGSDSNSGTSKTAPWLHAPGMPKCTATCASVKPAPGDSYIFRGGDTWHFGASSTMTYVGSSGWDWTWNGSNGNPIYIGVDQTWYSGSAWVRPIMSGDNPLSTSFVSSCSYDQSTANALWLNQASYVTVDNFEWPGRCWSSPSSNSAAIYSYQTCNVIISNNYFHGWTAVSGSEDNQMILGGSNGSSCGSATHNQIVGNVFDGSDSSAGTANSSACSRGFEPGMPCQSGMGIYSEGYDIHGNVFRYLSNIAVTVNTSTFHDNLAEYLYTSYAPSDIAPHSNVLNEVTNISGASTSFYNNVIRHTYVSQDIYLTVGSGGAAYVFNNVFFDNLRYDASGDSAPTNCIHLQAQSSSGSQSLYFYNNTMDNDVGDPTGGGCQLDFMQAGAPTYAWNGPAYFENNHLIGYGTLSNLYVCNSGATCSYKDNGNEIYQTEAVANSQGYVPGNNYSPTAGGATIGAGSIISSSTCNVFSQSSALCSGTSDGANEQNSKGGETAVSPAITVIPRTPSWDVGAYQFGGTSAPTPPTGLAAIVQ